MRSVRQLAKWYAELWEKWQAASSEVEARVIAEQAHRVHQAIYRKKLAAVAQ